MGRHAFLNTYCCVMPKQKRLGECLVQAGVITETQLEHALRLQQELSLIHI